MRPVQRDGCVQAFLCSSMKKTSVSLVMLANESYCTEIISVLHLFIFSSNFVLKVLEAACSSVSPQQTHQALADKKQLHVVEFRPQCGPLPVVVASPKDGARPNPELEGEIPNTKPHWDDVQAAQGFKRSIWAGVKRTVW